MFNNLKKLLNEFLSLLYYKENKFAMIENAETN